MYVEHIKSAYLRSSNAGVGQEKLGEEDPKCQERVRSEMVVFCCEEDKVGLELHHLG